MLRGAWRMLALVVTMRGRGRVRAAEASGCSAPRTQRKELRKVGARVHFSEVSRQLAATDSVLDRRQGGLFGKEPPMTRRPRIDLPRIPQHVVQRGNDRQPCFFTDAHRHRYLQDLREIALREGCTVHAYVLMTNHLRCRSSLIDGDTDLLRCYRYIELNPVRTHVHRSGGLLPGLATARAPWVTTTHSSMRTRSTRASARRAEIATLPTAPSNWKHSPTRISRRSGCIFNASTHSDPIASAPPSRPRSPDRSGPLKIGRPAKSEVHRELEPAPPPF